MFQNLDQIKKILLYSFFSLTVLIGFFLNEDTGGSGGYIDDFNNTFLLIQEPNKYFDLDLTVHFPLHYYLSNLIYLSLNSNAYLFRLLFCIISLIVPYLFFLCLKEKYKKNNNIIYYFSLIIFLLPNFRSAAIWANTQSTALIFFLLSLYFFLRSEKKNFVLYSNILLSIFFLSLALYTRQLYAIFFIFLIFVLFKKIKFEKFLKICFFIFLLSLPGLYIVSQKTDTLSLTYSFDFQNSILVTSSILSFYLIPYFVVLNIFHKIKLFNSIKDIYVILILFFIVFFLSMFFSYNYKIGGGFFLKFSIILFNNKILFYLTSIVGFYLIYKLINDNINNLILSILILFSFPAFMIFQKYFEPMFLIILFLLYKNNYNHLILEKKKSVFMFFLYYLIYVFTAIFNNVYLVTKSL